MRTLRFAFAVFFALPVAGTCFSACGGSVNEAATPETDTGGGGTDVALVEGGDTSTTTDTGVKTDSTTPPTDSGIKCGSEVCDAASQECCAGTSGLKCVAKGGCGGGTVIPCSDPSSCKSGEVCCAMREGFGLKVACSATCSGFSLCTSDADCKSPEKCAPGFAGYKYCSGRDGGTGFDASGFLDAPKGG